MTKFNLKLPFFALVQHPFFLVIVLTGLIVYFFPDYFSEYNLELTKHERAPSESKIYFEDLDGDGQSEKVVCVKNTLGDASFMVYNERDELLDQWNFHSEFINGYKNISFHDVDNNGHKEISLITRKEKVAYLQIIEPLKRQGIDRRMIYIDSVLPHLDSILPNDEIFQVGSGYEIISKKNQGQSTLYFSLSSGFSGYPRTAYSYNTETNEISNSPYLTNTFYVSQVMDINDDGLNEVLLHCISSCNEAPLNYAAKSDYSSWLTVLDDKMGFLFEPIEFKIPFSTVKSFSFKENNTYKIASFLNTKKGANYPPRLILLSINGNILKEVSLPRGKYKFDHDNDNKLFKLYNLLNGDYFHADYDLNLSTSLKLDAHADFASNDLTNDGKQESITISHSNSNLKVYQGEFLNETNYSLSFNDNSFVNFGSVQSEYNPNSIFVQKGRDLYYFAYKMNELHAMRYLLYFGVFVGVYLIYLFVSTMGRIALKSIKKVGNKMPNWEPKGGEWEILTAREIEVALLVADGLTSKKIGEKLFLSRHTIDTHRRNILDKTECKNAVELAKFVMRNDPLSFTNT